MKVHYVYTSIYKWSKSENKYRKCDVTGSSKNVQMNLDPPIAASKFHTMVSNSLGPSTHTSTNIPTVGNKFVDTPKFYLFEIYADDFLLCCMTTNYVSIDSSC